MNRFNVEDRVRLTKEAKNAIPTLPDIQRGFLPRTKEERNGEFVVKSIYELITVVYMSVSVITGNEYFLLDEEVELVSSRDMVKVKRRLLK